MKDEKGTELPNKMSVARALAELKLIDQKIDKKINQLKVTDVFQNRVNRTLGTHKTKEDFEYDAKADFQSLSDLMTRQIMLKRAILLSNVATTVTIGGIQMTVAEAIYRKTLMEQKSSLIGKLKQEVGSMQNQIDSQNRKLDEQVMALVAQALGTQKKYTDEEYKTISEPVRQANEFRPVDPIGASVVIEKLSDELDEFRKDVDFALSESNAKTEVALTV